MTGPAYKAEYRTRNWRHAQYGAFGPVKECDVETRIFDQSSVWRKDIINKGDQHMRKVIYLSLLFLCVTTVAGCLRPIQHAAHDDSVTGNVTYTMQADLPDAALVTVQLRDVTSGLAVSTLIGQQVIATNGNPPPYGFEVTFPPAAIDQSHNYAIAGFHRRWCRSHHLQVGYDGSGADPREFYGWH